MFFHNFKYTLKTLFKNKTLIFWTFAFPIILGTLFSFAFSNIESSEKLAVIDIAIVNDEELKEDKILKNAFENLSKENEDKLFNISYTTEEEANKLLENDKIIGFLNIKDKKAKVVVKQNGINETIFKYVVEEISQYKILTDDIASSKIAEEYKKGNINIDYGKLYTDIVDKLNEDSVNIENISKSNLSYTMIEYYTLIAMACLYSAMLGVYAINKSLANMSATGKRMAITPISKFKLLSSSILASYITQIIGVMLLFLYTIFVLNVDYSDKILPILLLIFVGSLAGLTFGIAVGTLFKTNENNKIGIIISFTMLGCFLSGMMGITMKYIIDKNVPIVNKLNPASMITDGFYSLYYYSGYERYFVNIISLVIFSLLMVILSFIVLRRQKYDSI